MQWVPSNASDCLVYERVRTQITSSDALLLPISISNTNNNNASNHT